MDSGPPKRKWKLSLVEWLTVIAIVGFLVTVLTPPIGHGISNATRRKISQIDMITLADAMNQHRLKYGEYPTGDVGMVVNVLTGDNLDQVSFLDPRRFRFLNEKKEPVDFWRTPYRIETNSTNGLSIRSAGPNRRFGDADDLEQSL